MAFYALTRENEGEYTGGAALLAYVGDEAIYWAYDDEGDDLAELGAEKIADDWAALKNDGPPEVRDRVFTAIVRDREKSTGRVYERRLSRADASDPYTDREIVDDWRIPSYAYHTPQAAREAQAAFDRSEGIERSSDKRRGGP